MSKTILIEREVFHQMMRRLSGHMKNEYQPDGVHMAIKDLAGSMEFGASFSYLKWAVDSLDNTKKIDINLIDDKSPVVVRASGDKDSTRVILPRRL